MKKRASIVAAILLLAVGFAAISTTLIINGNASVGENTENFDVIFTDASLDGTYVYKTVIDDTKKIINFTTSDLKTINQTSILTYKVTNNSSNYDAEVEVNCKVKDNTTAKYTSIENVLEDDATVIKAKETVNGTLTVTLNKTATEEVHEEYTCEITANAIERDKVGRVSYRYAALYNGKLEVGSTNANNDVYIRIGSDNSKAVCVTAKHISGEFCLNANDYDNSVATLKEKFYRVANSDGLKKTYAEGDVFGYTTGNSIFCAAYYDGAVECYLLDTIFCSVNADGTYKCEAE